MAGDVIKQIASGGSEALKTLDKNANASDKNSSAPDLQTLCDRAAQGLGVPPRLELTTLILSEYFIGEELLGCGTAAQYCIRESLHRKFGNKLCVIGEEDLADEDKSLHILESDVCAAALRCSDSLPPQLQKATVHDFVVWVDPVDGTTEFAQGVKEQSPLLEQATVLLGVSYKGEPVAGVVHQPYYGISALHLQGGAGDKNRRPPATLGRTVWAIKGGGVHGIVPRTGISGALTACTTRSHRSELCESALDALISARLVDQVVRVGGAGYKALLLLESAHAYVFPSRGMKKWDTCAPEIILREAGGELTDARGTRLRYESTVERMNSHGVLATAPGVQHSDYVAAMPERVKGAL